MLFSLTNFRLSAYLKGVVRLIHWWKTRSTRSKLPTCRQL